MQTIEPASPLDWRESGDGYTIVDAHGVRTCNVANANDRAYIVATANAYPHLKAQLDKALEACRWVEAARRLAVAQIVNWSRFTCATYDKCQAKERRCLAQAKRLARKALEMEERECHA